MKISSLAVAAIFGLTGTAAFAQTLNTAGWYVSPTVGYVINDSSRVKDSGGAVGLAIGKVLNDKWNVELSSQYLRMDGTDDEQGSIGVDGLYFLNRNPAFAPYATLGLAYSREGATNNSNSKNENLMTKTGIGFTKKLTNKIDFRTDVRYQWHGNKDRHSGASSLGDWVISVGLNISLDK